LPDLAARCLIIIIIIIHFLYEKNINNIKLHTILTNEGSLVENFWHGRWVFFSSFDKFKKIKINDQISA
jgi:hypothetical protein